MTILSAHIPEAGYGKKIILHDIDLEIEEKSIVAFIGPNGAGKSTLLKALMGIVSTPNGRVVFQEKEITKIPVEQRVQTGLAFVPQGNRVFTELTVRENLEMGGYLLKDKGGISHRIDELIGNLSRSQRSTVQGCRYFERWREAAACSCPCIDVEILRYYCLMSHLLVFPPKILSVLSL